MRRVSWASTRFSSSSRVFSAAARIAGLVISLNTMRRTGTVGLRTSSRCHAMASPSRSGSVASSSSSQSFSFALRSATFFFLSGLTTYSGAKPFSVSTPRRAQGSFLYFTGTSAAPRGRSRMWPTEASTI